MTSRRSFLRTLGLASAGAVLVGPDVLEAFARLTHVRKSFPSAGIPGAYSLNSAMTEIYSKVNREVYEAMRAMTEEYSWVDDDSPTSLFVSEPVGLEMRLTLDGLYTPTRRLSLVA